MIRLLDSCVDRFVELFRVRFGGVWFSGVSGGVCGVAELGGC